MTCTWKIRRRAGRVAAVATTVAMLSGLAASQASASNLGDLQAQARAIEGRIQVLSGQEEALSEQYDAGNIALAKVRAQVASAQAEVTTATRRADTAERILRADAINAYVNDGTASLSQSGAASTVAGADNSLLRVEYEQTLASNQTNSEDAYKLASRQANTAESNLKTQEAAAAANVKTIARDAASVQSTADSLQSVEQQDTGRIAAIIHQQQVAAAAAEQRAAEARIAAARQQADEQQAAQQDASATTDPAETPTAEPPDTTQVSSSPTSVDPPPSGTSGGSSGGAPVPSGGGSIAAEAVAAAESRVGDPYVWGAAGPSSFDCSGLVMWAYAQAGVSLPHYSGSQYADTTHISMGDLEPGDLVFFANPGEHVAMYVGDGEVVQAPYTGADVQIVPLYSEFVLASRVA